MLNEHLFNDKKDIQIARLKMAIEDFKKYDERRKQYYAKKIRRLQTLDELLREIEGAEKDDLRKILLRQRADLARLNKIIQVHNIEERRSPEELSRLINIDTIKRQNETYRENEKTMQATIDELTLKVKELKRELKALRRRTPHP